MEMVNRLQAVFAIAAVLALSCIGSADACDGDLVVSGSTNNMFDGTYSRTGATYTDNPVWTCPSTIVGSKSIFRSSHPSGVWAVQDSTAGDASLSFYAFAVSTAADPSLVAPGAFNEYFASAVITCLEEGAAPAPQPAPAVEPQTSAGTPQTCLNSGYSAVPSNVDSTCHAYCGCNGAAGTCDQCCKFEKGFCFRGAELPVTFQSADAGFSRQCDYSKCTADMSSNGKCDGACNNPDCGFDGGECCASNYRRTYGWGSTHPLNCQSDTATEDADYFRIEYHMPSCRKHVRDQGTCGSAAAFATTTAVAYQKCMAGDDTHHRQLSPQFIDSCYSQEQGGGGMCSGGIIEYNAKELTASSTARGIPYESCYPYLSSDRDTTDPLACSAVSAGCSSSENTFVKIKSTSNIRTNPKEFYAMDFTPENIPTIKAFLRHVGPLTFRFDVDEAFQNNYDASNGFLWDDKNGRHAGLYHSDYSNKVSAKTGGHAMVCTGYGHFDDRNGVQKNYFVFENSWGYAQNHDIGYVYWDMADTQAYARLNAVFVAAGASRVAGVDDAYIHSHTFCSDGTGTCGGDIGANAGRKLLGISSSSLHRFSRRMLADGLSTINADGLINPIKGAGEIEETECTRDNAMGAIAEAVAKITEALSEATGMDVKVDLKEMKSCLSQASAAENFFFDFTVNVDDIFRKNVQINITKLPAGPCLRALPEDPDKCADEIGESGLRLSQFKFTGVFMADDGSQEFTFAGLPDAGTSDKVVTEIHYVNQTVIHMSQDSSVGSSVNFWQVFGAVVAGGVTVVVLVAIVRVVLQRVGGKRQEPPAAQWPAKNFEAPAAAPPAAK